MPCEHDLADSEDVEVLDDPKMHKKHLITLYIYNDTIYLYLNYNTGESQANGYIDC